MLHATKFTVDPGWKIVLNDLGLSIDELLRRAQLPLDLFSRKNAMLSTDEYFRLWSALESTLNDPSFPLTLGQMISTEAFSPPIFAALVSPDLNVAVERLSKYKQLIGPMKLDVKQTNNDTTMTVDCLYTNKLLPDTLIAVEMVFLVHLVRLGTREPIKPIFVSSTSSWANPNGYAEFFGIMPVAGKANQIRFSAQDATRPFLTENLSMWRFFEPELRKRLSDITSEETFADRVRSSLFELLPSGLSSSDDVAKKLAVSKRTLQRYLKNENTSFQQELNRTRENLARHYLTRSKLSGSEISFLLGFDDPNSFNRAFRSWTGQTPEKVRAAAG